MKKKIILLPLFACLISSCSKNEETKFVTGQNADKPVVFYGTPVLTQNTLNGSYQLEYDDEALSFNDKTLYVGLNYDELANLQADMIYNYIQVNKDTINRKKKNSAGEVIDENNILSYILVTDDNSSLLSRMQIRAIRKRLGTLETDANGSEILDCGSEVSIKKQGTLQFTNADDTKTEFSVEEASSIVMKGSISSVDTLTRNIFTEREADTSSRPIDLVITVNDALSVSCYNNWCRNNKVPVFGFGGNSDALKCMQDKVDVPYAGTVYVNNSYLAYMKARALYNLMENKDNFYEYGITVADDQGCYLENGSKYIKYVTNSNNNSKKLLLSGRIVNYTNASEYSNYDERKNFDSTLKYTSTANHKIWYSRILTDRSIISDEAAKDIDDYEYTYDKKYFSMLNLNEQMTDEGRTTDYYKLQNEKYFLKQFVNLNDYDGYLIELYKSTNAKEYLSAIKQ